jgi:hypothetical protein
MKFGSDFDHAPSNSDEHRIGFDRNYSDPTPPPRESPGALFEKIMILVTALNVVAKGRLIE